MRLLSTLKARWRLRQEVGLWYHPDYAAATLSWTSRSSVVDPRRGDFVISQLVRERLVRARDVRLAPRVSPAELCRFHPLSYLESTATPETLCRIFALDPGQADIDQLVESQRRAVGGTIAAARAVVDGEVETAINLGGGFHHAEPESGSGFCVYNDIGVAIAALRQSGYQRGIEVGHGDEARYERSERGRPVERIAIVDLDYHQGNGNLVAFADDRTVFTFSIHGAVWSHRDPGNGREVHLSANVDDDRYLATLRGMLLSGLRAFAPQLVFYIAGNDVLAGDQLGGFKLTPQGVLERDIHVAQCVSAVGAKLIVTLGGGYSKNAWHCTTNFVRYLLTGEQRADTDAEPNLAGEFRRIAREIDPQDLQKETMDLVLTEEDIYEDLMGAKPARKLLGYYTRQGLEFALERYGLLPKIRRRGFVDLRVSLDAKDPTHQIIRVHGIRGTQSEPYLLTEVVLRRAWIKPMVSEAVEEAFELLFIEWLLLQDPSRTFTLERPRLPGQDHPGLGTARETIEILIQASRRLSLHGLFHRPAYYHTAFDVPGRRFFLDPKEEGRFRAMRTALTGYGLAESTMLIDRKHLALADGTPMAWQPADHVLPLTEELRRCFTCEAYEEAVKTEQDRLLDLGLHVIS